MDLLLQTELQRDTPRLSINRLRLPSQAYTSIDMDDAHGLFHVSTLALAGFNNAGAACAKEVCSSESLG